MHQRAAEDPAPDVRLTAVQALRRCWRADPISVTLLSRLVVEDRMPTVRRAAATA